MKKTVFRIVIFLAVFFAVFNHVKFTIAQIPLIPQLSLLPVSGDTTDNNLVVSVENVNKEIEYTDNLILKRGLSDFAVAKQQVLIHEIDSFNNYIDKQGQEFRTLASNKLWRFYLINARVNWNEYGDQLHNYQSQLHKDIRDLQEQQSFYIVNRDKWVKSLPQLEKSISSQISGYIKSNIEKLNKIIKQYDESIKNLVSSENKIVQNLVYTEGILNEIEGLINKRNTDLFKPNEKNIFATSYDNSFEGSFLSRLKLAFYENTKNFGYFVKSIKNNLFWYIVLIVAMMFYFLFIKKKYLRLKHNESHPGHLFINKLIIELPLLTTVTLLIIIWSYITPYSPLIVSLFLYLTSLILLRFLLPSGINPFFKKVSFTVIVLLAIINFEIFAWYFGNYSRFYLLFEAIVGIILTFRIIYPLIKEKRIHKVRGRTINYTLFIIYAIFILDLISLVANITGFEYMAGYTLKLGIFAGTITILSMGFYRIAETLIISGKYVLDIYYPNIIINYGDVITTRSTRLLNILVGYYWIYAMLHLTEFWDSVSSKLIAFFTHKVVIGSLSFTMGKMIFFLLVLYFTFISATFIKRIFEREILSKYRLKRGLAASISLTIRIFLVFFGTLIALSVSGLDLGKISIIAGALSVGIGFGLQNIVSNFISGLILVYEKPLQEGDTIEVGTLLGRVSNIGTRSSTITTYDGAEVVVPNSNLISNQLINWTLSDNRKRIEIQVGTSYDSDPHQVLEILRKAALSHEKVIRRPEPASYFVGFGDSSLNFRLLFWVRFDDGMPTQSDVALKIFDLLKENKIEIPYPQLDLHIKGEKNSIQDSQL